MPDVLDFASVDVSFISLALILPVLKNLLKFNSRAVCLIKPQFEAGRDKVGKKGVVRERSVHEEVVRKILDYADSIGFEILHLEFSPIKGPEGNIEYLMHIQKNGEKALEKAALTEKDAEEILDQIIQEKSGITYTDSWNKVICEIVDKAHLNLDKAE